MPKPKCTCTQTPLLYGKTNFDWRKQFPANRSQTFEPKCSHHRNVSAFQGTQRQGFVGRGKDLASFSGRCHRQDRLAQVAHVLGFFIKWTFARNALQNPIKCLKFGVWTSMIAPSGLSPRSAMEPCTFSFVRVVPNATGAFGARTRWPDLLRTFISDPFWFGWTTWKCELDMQSERSCFVWSTPRLCEVKWMHDMKGRLVHGAFLFPAPSKLHLSMQWKLSKCQLTLY